MSTPGTFQPAQRTSLLRKLLYVVVVLVLLLVAVFFVVTSGGFFKSVILPKVGKSMNAEITVSDASISPFSEVDLKQLKVQTTGTEPLFQAREVRLRYSLFSILGGTLKVDEILADTPVIQVVENPDGTSNLDPLTKNAATNAAAPAKESEPSKSSKPPKIELKNFAIKNAEIRYVKNFNGGSNQTVDLTGINVTLDQLMNGASGKLTANAAAKVTGLTNGQLEAKASADVEFSLGQDLMPTAVKAKIDEEVVKADGDFARLAGFRSSLTSDMTPTEVKEFAERFYQNDQLLAEIKASGPLDMTKKEGHLKIEAGPFTSKLLNIPGEPMGIDFGSTELFYTMALDISHGGSDIEVNTRFTGTNVTVAKNGQTTPAINFAAGYDVTADLDKNSAVIKSVTFEGTEDEKQFLHASLDQPLTIAWGAKAPPAGDATLILNVADFKLQPWQAFIGTNISSGNLAAGLKVSSSQGGKSLSIALTSELTDLAMKLGAKDISQGALTAKVDVEVTDLKKYVLKDYALDLTDQGQPALHVAGSAGYDGAAFNLQSDAQIVPKELLGKGSPKPITIGAKLDGSFANQKLDLKDLAISFPATAHAASNVLHAVGQVDMSSPELTVGELKVTADTLDLTPVYNAFTEPSPANPEATAPPASPAETSQSSGNTEPAAIKIPLRFTADVTIGDAWLRQIEAQKAQLTAKIEPSKVVLDPISVVVNGGPIKGTVNLDLGVDGYVYAVNLQMDKVPLEPLANSFTPPENAGKYKGLILASADLKGAGVTGTSLKKNLNGQAGFSFTNAEIQLTGPKLKKVAGPIANLLGLQDLLNSPLSWVDAHLDFGGGNIKVSRCIVESPVFEGSLQGTIPIADVLTNSPLNLPLQISLKRSLADSVGLLPANTPPDAKYAALPNFVTVKGTIGQPKSDVDKMALGEVFLNSGKGIVNRLGGKAGGTANDVVNSLGNLLDGSRKSGGSNTSTNAPSKNPFGSLFK